MLTITTCSDGNPVLRLKGLMLSKALHAVLLYDTVDKHVPTIEMKYSNNFPRFKLYTDPES